MVKITLKTNENERKKIARGGGANQELGLEPRVYKRWYRDTTTKSKDVGGSEIMIIDKKRRETRKERERTIVSEQVAERERDRWRERDRYR